MDDQRQSPSAGTRWGTRLRDVLDMDDDAVGAPAYHLASMAECATPDLPGSPGAAWLEDVAWAMIEEWDAADKDDRADMIVDRELHDIADGMVPIYTAQIWRVFVDLGAWQEDPSELGADCSDMEKAARVALYMIAERVCAAILDTLADAEDIDA